MLEKWERQPFRVGLVAGFLLLPLLRWAQENLLRLVIDFRSPSNFDLINYFVAGAIPGAILGGGISKAVAAYRTGNRSDAKWHLLSHGGCVFTLILLILMPAILVTASNPSPTLLGQPIPFWLAIFLAPFIITNFPLHCALYNTDFGNCNALAPLKLLQNRAIHRL